MIVSLLLIYAAFPPNIPPPPPELPPPTASSYASQHGPQQVLRKNVNIIFLPYGIYDAAYHIPAHTSTINKNRTKN